MIQRLPDSPDGSDPPYHRPNDKWVVVPIGSGSDSSHETESRTLRKPSLRTRRRNFTAACTAFAIGAILIACSSPYSKEILVPGPLSSHHAPLVAGEGSARCATCHANANGSLTQWIAATFVSARTKGVSQSELCMKCHEQSLAKDFALNPHNVDPMELEWMTNRLKPTSFDAGMLFHPPVNDENQIACSVCHQEHHGGKDLTMLTDAQCQTCHGHSFHSFETDHPEFANWPQQRRSRIAFDHSTHSGQHYPGKQRSFNCNQCHVDDAFQNVKRLASFEQSCADCHNQQILDSGTQGLALIALPMIDMKAVESANLNIGSWPLAATGDFDGAIPPMMRVMLAADPEASLILDRLGADFDFADINPTNHENVNDSVQLVWAIKRLLYDLSLDGPRAVRSRLESVLGFEISDEHLQRIITNLDEPVFQNAVRRWLPDLTVEVAIHRFGEPVLETSLAESNQNSFRLQKSNMAWRPTVADTLLRIQNEDSLLANNPLAGLVEPLNRELVPVAMPVVRVPDRENNSAIETVEPQQKREQDSGWRSNVHADPEKDPMLLAVNPLKQLLENGAGNKVETEPAFPKVIVAPAPTVGFHQEAEPNQASSSKLPAGIGARDTGLFGNVAAVPHEPLIVPSGWFRNDKTFQISYRPRGHADDCLQSWIELVTRAADADTRSETQQLFEKTISMTGIGLCRSCHTVDQLADRSFVVNWQAEFRNPAVRSFTRFAHGPHLLQPELKDCSHCHQLNQKVGNAESFLSVDAAHVVSNFLPITKSDCASCHQQGRTNNSCTQCHNYHVGSRVIGSK